MATNYRAMARNAAKRYGLDPGIFERQIQQESGFNPTARSPAGAAGIAQIMPGTAKGWGVDPMDPKAALNAAAKNMAAYVKKYGGYENALRAYNAGPGAIQASKGYGETNNYVRIILGGKDPKKLGTPSSGGGGGGGGGSAGSQTVIPGAKIGSTITTGGDIALPTLPERQKAQVTGPALPSYVRTPPPTISMPDRSNREASLKEALAVISKVPQTTYSTETVTAPTTINRDDGGGGGGGGGGSGGGTVNLKGGGSKVKQLIFNDGGKGYGIYEGQEVDGRQVYNSVWGGHANHVHVGAGPKTVVALGKVAQRMGLHVGENPAFGGVDPVHVKNSLHYRNQAIDVSGSKPLMTKFAKYVADYNRSHS